MTGEGGEPRLAWFAGASTRELVLAGLGLALLIELVTVGFRFGLGMESTRDTGFMARLTFGWRIHHGYVGALLLALAPGLAPGRLRGAAVVLGIGLLVSDLVHHFLVLWPITGSPQFDLRYPEAPPEATSGPSRP